jgi:hypothetical protein
LEILTLSSNKTNRTSQTFLKMVLSQKVKAREVHFEDN